MPSFTLPSGRAVETREPLFGEYIHLTSTAPDSVEDLVYAKFAIIVPALSRDEIASLNRDDGFAISEEIKRIWEGPPKAVPVVQWWAAVIHGLEPKEANPEAEARLVEYWLAQLAGRLRWTLDQVKSVSGDVALLCERLGWLGPEGFAQLEQLPRQTVQDWLAIADLQAEREKRAQRQG